MKKIFIAFSIALLSVSSPAFSQSFKTPVGSPLAVVKQNVGISDIAVEYSRPSAKDRVVFGEVVPYGELWRTGANACTKLTFGADMTINGKLIPAGTYSLLTIPEKTQWTVILNKNTTLGGTRGYSEAEDILRFKVTPKVKQDKVETFTIDFSNLKNNQLTVELMWENTLVAFDVTTDYDAEVMKNIEKTMEKDGRPYYQAASYYYENKKDLNKALEWASKAFEMNPSAFWIGTMKAKIQYELKDYKGAIATAETVKKIDGIDHAYKTQIDELIQKAKKGK